jgi:Restriction endonuclease
VPTPAWKRYEQQIAERIRSRAKGPVKITTNTTLPGRLSDTPRQIDILVEGSFAGVADASMVVDCKCWSSKIDVQDMETFIGMLEDVGVPLGMLMTTKGFTKAAQCRGTRVLQEVIPLINLATFDELSSYWLMRAGEPGDYVGDYLDHEPYGGFWWTVTFVTRDHQGEEEHDVLWASSDEGWEGDDGSTLLATILARHRLGKNPIPSEVEHLTKALERHIAAGQGFSFSTAEIDNWMWDEDEDEAE